MVAFTTAMLPTGINACTEVEQLKVWCDLILNDQIGARQLTRQEGEQLISVCARNFYRDKDGLERMECFSHMQLIAGWETTNPNLGLWKKAVTLANTAIPARFSIGG
jgi:hypothetical protein